MRRNFVCFSLVLLMVFSWSAGVYAYERALGDNGKPSNYNSTLMNFNAQQYKFNGSTFDYNTFIKKLPTTFNWKSKGKVTPAKDQGSCGSCWAFAAVGVLESKFLIADGKKYDLSEQQLVSCNTSMKGCRGGNMAALKYWGSKIPALEQSANYCACETSCANLNLSHQPFLSDIGYYTVNTNNRNEIKTSLYNHGPAYFRFNVYADFYNFWNIYKPGNVYVQSAGSKRGGHAVMIIGWNDNKKAWLCKNSWGKTAGPNGDGTFWIAYSGHANNLAFGMANLKKAPNVSFGTLTPL